MKALFCIAVILLSSYVYLGGPDNTVHPGRYNGTSGATQYVSIGLDASMPAEAKTAVRNAVKIWNNRTIRNPNFGNGGWVPPSHMDFQSVLLHELGHVHGLGHVPGSGSYQPVLAQGLQNGQVRIGLHHDDVAGLENALLGINDKPYSYELLCFDFNSDPGGNLDVTILESTSTSFADTTITGTTRIAAGHDNLFGADVAFAPTPDVNSLWYYHQIADEDDTDWHNDHNSLDVNRDAWVSPSDVLAIINYINANGSGPNGSGPTSKAYDTNDDGFTTPSDALKIINYINSF